MTRVITFKKIKEVGYTFYKVELFNKGGELLEKKNFAYKKDAEDYIREQQDIEIIKDL